MKKSYTGAIAAIIAAASLICMSGCAENGVKPGPANTGAQTSAETTENTVETTTTEAVTTETTTEVTTAETTTEVTTAETTTAETTTATTTAETSETDTSPVTTEEVTEPVTEKDAKTTTIPDEPDYTYIEESGTLTLVINEIKDGEYICSLPWPFPAIYHVPCGDEAEYCVGDTIEVVYNSMIQTSDWDFTVNAEKIGDGFFEIEEDVCYKPVIYLYPEEKTDAKVTLDYNGRLTVTYPEYKNGWEVTALPDGTLYDKDGNEYSYLFWEGESNFSMSIDEGFCVKGEDTVEFLREKLSYLGLTPKEYNDFIVFWLPFMQDNEYNLISFQTETYTDNAKLTVSPSPDTVIRVFMTFTPCNSYVDIPEQELTPAPLRNGFTVVEWGGSIIR